jgi:uncharacterized protein (DUF427 family)
VDSTRAVLVWEPRRIVPSYAVPVQDVAGDMVRAGTAAVGAADGVGSRLPDVSAHPVLSPADPFAVHTAEGHGAFDAWYEEDELNVAHPRDPFHRVDVLSSSRRVRLELDGQVLAESSRPMLLFETMLPARYYLPRADILTELVPSGTRTYCAYKGQASYWSVTIGGRVLPDIAWTYEKPLHDAMRVRDLIAFFGERINVVLDGKRLERPITPWSAGPEA